MSYYIVSDELYHHGILGQKWGVRRYQNPDGSLTAGMLTENAYGEELMHARTVLQSALNDAELEAEYERATKEWKIKK